MKPSQVMQHMIEQLAEKHNFDLTAADGSGLKIENPPFMPLNITAYGKGRVAVNHSITDEYWHETTYDPEIVFMTLCDGWYGITYEQQSMGIYQVAAEIEDGKLLSINTKQQADIGGFANEWARNIKRQGFLDDDVTVTICK